jgi:hypothetical protein
VLYVAHPSEAVKRGGGPGQAHETVSKYQPTVHRLEQGH